MIFDSDESSVDVLFPIKENHRYLKFAVESIRASVGLKTRIIFIDNSVNGVFANNEVITSDDLYIRARIPGFANAMNQPLIEQIEFNQFIAYMNSDDLISPDRFIKQVQALKRSGADLCITNQIRFRGNSVYESFFGNPGRNPYHPLFLVFGAYGADPTWCFRSSLIRKMPLRDNLIHHDLVDLKLAIELFPFIKLVALDEKLYKYRSHKSQISRNMATLDDFKSIVTPYVAFLEHFGVEAESPEAMFALRPQSVSSILKQGKNIRQEALLFLDNVDAILKIENIHTNNLANFVNFRRNLISNKRLTTIGKRGLKHIIQK